MVFLILDLKKGRDKTLKNISTLSEDFNLTLNGISILTFFQFYCKVNRNQSEIVVEATYGLHPD